MKICHVYYSLNYGGIEVLIVNISRWQVNNNHDVHVILLNAQLDVNLISTMDPRVKLIRVNRRVASKNPLHILLLNFYLIKNNYDVIHIHSAAITRFISPLLRSKILLHVHETLGPYQLRELRYNRCICISSVVQSILVKNNITRNLFVLYSGVDFDGFEQKKNNLIVNKIVCVARLDIKIKNQEYIINEFNIIKDKVNSNLYIIGEGEDFKILFDLIFKLNLSSRIFLLGAKSQDWLQNNLCNFDLFIQASKFEGLGISAIESAAAGVPMFLSSIEGHLEVSGNGKYCKLFNPYNQGELSELILDFYKYPDFYLEMAANNRVEMKEKFDYKVFNKKLLEYYFQICNKSFE